MTLDEFEALEKKVTPGPWVLDGLYGIVKDHDGLLFYCDAAYVSDQESERNKAFVCACREIVPKMIKVASLARKVLNDVPAISSIFMLSLDEALDELEQP